MIKNYPRAYYIARIDPCSLDMRIGYMKCLEHTKIRFLKGGYIKIGCPEIHKEAIEYDLRKAARNDGWGCKWARCRRDEKEIVDQKVH
jgi:hypothetical protein